MRRNEHLVLIPVSPCVWNLELREIVQVNDFEQYLVDTMLSECYFSFNSRSMVIIYFTIYDYKELRSMIITLIIYLLMHMFQ